MRAAFFVAILAGCASSASPAPAETEGGERTADVACISDDERDHVSLEGTTEERMARAREAIDVPSSGSLGAGEQLAASVHGVVLLESIERDSESGIEGRIAGLMELDVLETIAEARPSCRPHACQRLGSILERRCTEELPADDVTAICPTLRRFATRCAEGS